LRIGSKWGVGGSSLLAVSFERERPGVAAIRIIGTADEGAEFAELDAESPRAADRTKARIAPGALVWKKMPAELGLESGQHLADGQLFGAINRGRKIPPEITQHLLPIGASARHVVELVLEVRGEAVLDIALEKARQKGSDEPPAVFRHKAPLLKP